MAQVHLIRKKEVKEYIKEKIYILENHFLLKLTAEEKAHLKSIDTIGGVDRYAYDLISKKL